MKSKTIEDLIIHLKDNKHIQIDFKNKQNLINMGYFHSYKGYRFIGKPYNKINLTNFNEIEALHDFDLKLKSLFYSKVMLFETITKNVVLQLLIEEYGTNYLDDIFEKGMTDYKNTTTKEYKSKMKHRLKVNNNINTSLIHNYTNNNRIITHFYSKDQKVPLWAVFEVITLGIFADFVKSLELNTRKKICQSLNITNQFDTNAMFPEKILYLVKAIRNSIAHNDVIFDVRFKDSNIDTNICKYLSKETGCTNIKFNTITDYFIIICVMLKKLNIDNQEIIKFINDFEDLIEDFRNKVNVCIYHQIIHTDVKQKILQINNYVK